MFRHILFPVDFSEPCTRTAPAVQRWAESLGARVTLLHASGTNEPNDKIADFLPGFDAQRLSVPGQAADTIVAQAKILGADLIMMPTLGYTRFRQLLLGSVTTSVLHDSELPVWTCAHVEKPLSSAQVRSIVVAVDCGPHTATVLNHAQQIAAAFGATVRVVYSNPRVDARFDSAIAARAHQFVVQSAREDYAAATEGIDAPALEVVEGATIAAGVQAVVYDASADLLVIGRGKMQGFMGRLRTNAHELIRLSGCPVLSI